MKHDTTHGPEEVEQYVGEEKSEEARMDGSTA